MTRDDLAERLAQLQPDTDGCEITISVTPSATARRLAFLERMRRIRAHIMDLNVKPALKLMAMEIARQIEETGDSTTPLEKFISECRNEELAKVTGLSTRTITRYNRYLEHVVAGLLSDTGLTS